LFRIQLISSGLVFQVTMILRIKGRYSNIRSVRVFTHAHTHTHTHTLSLLIWNSHTCTHSIYISQTHTHTFIYTCTHSISLKHTHLHTHSQTNTHAISSSLSLSLSLSLKLHSFSSISISLKLTHTYLDSYTLSHLVSTVAAELEMHLFRCQYLKAFEHVKVLFGLLFLSNYQKVHFQALHHPFATSKEDWLYFSFESEHERNVWEREMEFPSISAKRHCIRNWMYVKGTKPWSCRSRLERLNNFKRTFKIFYLDWLFLFTVQ